MTLAVEAVAASIKRTKESSKAVRAEEAIMGAVQTLTSSQIFA